MLFQLSRGSSLENIFLASDKSKLWSFLCYGKCKNARLRTEDGYDIFCEDFSNLLDYYRNGNLIYVPIEEQTTDYVSMYVDNNGRENLLFLLPPAELYKQFRSKKGLNDYCLDRSKENLEYLLSYINPRDLDGGQPMLEGLPLKRKFNSYVGTKGAEKKLEKYLTDFQFTDVKTAAENLCWEKVPIVSL